MDLFYSHALSGRQTSISHAEHHSTLPIRISPRVHLHKPRTINILSSFYFLLRLAHEIIVNNSFRWTALLLKKSQRDVILITQYHARIELTMHPRYISTPIPFVGVHHISLLFPSIIF
ncbi:hypothetical protein QCA50_013533 [Cerrena zonata]|uniref:Uncharacterized protein n=1 Tax=Cerrena zonata TaxID=2478898 RepID=A0AAW0FR63_9APHY